ncbi:MAG: Trk system potassium transporter TrkA [Candidatus Dadabacteria bacterium]|nr:Trk system potassium transporter TrkA [Candidatus Dadabacteria bacterium]NIQ15316.1 Trk system potassium transporter TrkA [Candidatus Dadabacteria bacterium]
MRILIIGGGQVGLFIARQLSEQHEIVIIENSKDNADKIKNKYDVLTIIGNGDDPSVLREAEIEKAEVLLAVSGDDRTNILASIIGHSIGIKKIIMRIRSPHYLDYPQLLNEPEISVINPGNIISDKIYSLITAPFAWRTESFAEGKIELFKLRVEDQTPIVNMKLKDLGPAEAWIFVGISRGGKIQIPTGETRLHAGDYVFALGVPSVLKKLKEMFNLKFEKIHSAIIVGAGRLGKIVANRLYDEGISVKIIETDPERAKFAAEEMPGVTVYNGDATNSETLNEVGVDSADYLFALTGNDEENVLSALLAKNLGIKWSTVLYTNPDYIDVLEAIGVDRAISVRMAIANEVLSLLHIGGVAHVALLEEGRGEVLEFDVNENTEILGVQLADANLPDEAVIGFCIRGEEIIIPRGDFVAQSGDRLIVFALPNAVRKIEKILG